MPDHLNSKDTDHGHNGAGFRCGHRHLPLEYTSFVYHSTQMLPSQLKPDYSLSFTSVALRKLIMKQVLGKLQPNEQSLIKQRMEIRDSLESSLFVYILTQMLPSIYKNKDEYHRNTMKYYPGRELL